MYYRQKILLSILNSFGGELGNTDCQKIVFLFCKRSGINYYDFFPYKYGGFSNILYYDKRFLTEKGLLDSTDKFRIKNRDLSFTLNTIDTKMIGKLVEEINTNRGKELIRKIYLEFPYYAIKSEIIDSILTKNEQDHINQHNIHNKETCLFTIGYEGLSIDAFINKLIQNNISLAIDVRKNPLSRKYGFSKTKLSKYLNNSEIDYLHLPNLGIPSNYRQELNSTSDYLDLFSFYRTEILPNQITDIDQIKNVLKKKNRVALLCFEADHNFCHRTEIAKYLELDKSFSEKIYHIK